MSNRVVTLSQNDKLRMENVNLRLRNLQLEHTRLLKESEGLARQKEEVVSEMSNIRKDFIEKYGFDIATEMLNDKGEVVKSPFPSPFVSPGGVPAVGTAR